MMDAQQLIYLYDLPKDNITCNKIAQTIKDKSGIVLDANQKPQIKRDLTKPFFTAMVSIKDPKKFSEACEKMRYFEVDGKQCRALPFDKQLLGSNKDKLLTHNIFVKVPKELKHEDLHQMFEPMGKIKSLKISLNADYTSRGYGFICFQDEATAMQALQAKTIEGVEAIKFEPRDRRHFRKVINNIYVKNIPVEKTDEEITDLFKPFGNISYLSVAQHDKVKQFKFALISFDDPKKENKEYGPLCAQKAIEEMNDREVAPGVKLIVKSALKKAEREVEKMREIIRYKASKKRCNLFVKNFPNSWTEDNLRDLFKTFGEIENIKLGDRSRSTGNAYAFVCFKEPTDAAKAKQNLQNHSVDGKMLMINYYEIKEIRQLHMEEARDKADWEKYQAQQTGGLKWNDLTSQPHLAQMLQQLLGIIQYNERTQQQMNETENQRPRGPRQYNNRPPRQNFGQHPGGPGQQQMHPGQQMQQQQQPGMMGGQQMHHMMQGGPGGPKQQQPMPQNMVQQQPMPMQQQQQQMMHNQGNPAQMTIAQRYLQQTAKFISAIQPHNPHLKNQVGHAIYEFVQQLVGDEKAPKITGMLIELPLDQIKAYMSDFNNLNLKVQEALEHWENAQRDSQQMGQF